MAKSKKPKVTRNHTNDLRSARRMLTELRAYSGDFASAKLTQGALSIEVTFHGTPTKPAAPPAEAPKRRLPPQREIKPAVAMLDETPPAFDFEVS